MSVPFRTRRRVEFRETDAAGIAHFTAFFAYMAEAEHALLRHLGTSVVAQDSNGTVSWPRVSAACEFTGAVAFEDVLDVEVRVGRIGTKSVTYDVRFSKQGQTVATGSLTSVCCRIRENEPPQSIPIPLSLVRQLETFRDKPPHAPNTENTT